MPVFEFDAEVTYAATIEVEAEDPDEAEAKFTDGHWMTEQRTQRVDWDGTLTKEIGE